MYVKRSKIRDKDDHFAIKMQTLSNVGLMNDFLMHVVKKCSEGGQNDFSENRNTLTENQHPISVSKLHQPETKANRIKQYPRC